MNILYICRCGLKRLYACETRPPEKAASEKVSDRKGPSVTPRLHL